MLARGDRRELPETAKGERLARDLSSRIDAIRKQLAELGLKSWAERRWLDVPPLKA